MEFQVTEDNGIYNVSVSGDLNIYVAEEFKQQLFACIESSSETSLNLEDVSEIDSSGIQILLVAKSFAEKNTRTLMLTQKSSAVSEVCELYDIEI